jgi:hypothetical protein
MTTTALPVDLVYTWVDGNDDARRAARAEWLARCADACSDAATVNRARDRGELRYSLRSVEENLSWIRRIHIIVSGAQRPRWLLEHPRIQLVEDTQIFPDRNHLPTFNSQAIECHLDRVPGLADHYLYANDDFLFCRPIGRQSYFQADGTPLVAYWRHGWTARVRGKRYHAGWRGQPDRSETSFVSAWMNINALIDRQFGARRRWVTRHHAPALRKGMLTEAARVFPDAIERTSGSRFRAATDVAPVSLAQYVALCQGHAAHSQGGLREMVIPVGDELRTNRRLIWRARMTRPHLLCLNDMTSGHATPEVDAQVTAFLTSLFPKPSPFERLEA